MSKMFSVSFSATKEEYKEIDQQMTTKRFVKPVAKQVTDIVQANFVVYKPDSFFLTRLLQKMKIRYELKGDM